MLKICRVAQLKSRGNKASLIFNRLWYATPTRILHRLPDYLTNITSIAIGIHGMYARLTTEQGLNTKHGITGYYAANVKDNTSAYLSEVWVLEKKVTSNWPWPPLWSSGQSS
jgi:hypothetical protein